MGRMRDTARQCDNVSWRRCGTGEGKGGDDVTRILIDQKIIKKIYTIDLAVINGWWRFKIMIS
jgi:hypothetical protein